MMNAPPNLQLSRRLTETIKVCVSGDWQGIARSGSPSFQYHCSRSSGQTVIRSTEYQNEIQRSPQNS